MRKNINFIIIGFQSCGTTTLFQHLKQHPQVFMPFNKECTWEQGMTNISFMKKYFPKNYGKKIIGHATPSLGNDPKMAKVIHKYFPGVKIIAIIRPRKAQIESIWRRRTRRGEEHRSLDVCKIDKQYLKWSDRNTILTAYSSFFDLLILGLKDLEKYPQLTMDSIHNFLGIDNFKANTIGEKYNIGYDKPNRIIRFLKAIPFKVLIPQKIRTKIFLWLEIRSN